MLSKMAFRITFYFQKYFFTLVHNNEKSSYEWNYTSSKLVAKVSFQTYNAYMFHIIIKLQSIFASLMMNLVHYIQLLAHTHYPFLSNLVTTLKLHYVPRGWIHEIDSPARCSWGDVINLFTQAMSNSIPRSVSVRRGWDRYGMWESAGAEGFLRGIIQWELPQQL